MHPIAQRLAIHPGQLRRFSATPALQDQGDGQQAPNLSAIAALCCELAQCLGRMLRPCDRDCLAQLILLAANRRRENRTAISRDWESPARVRLFGGWYYSLYLSHVPVIAVVGLVWRRLIAEPTPGLHVAALASGFAVALAAGVASFHLIEMPLLRVSRRLTRVATAAPIR
jgi:peptidoglycan/LPS O-acetylase OafA/YrhL